MSLMKASNAAGFMVLVMPNSLAALSELEKSVACVRQAQHLRAGGLRLQQK